MCDLNKNSLSIMLLLLFIFYTPFRVYSQSKIDHETKIRELHRKYMQASINYDIETLRALVHEDIIWYLGTDTLTGKEAALAPHEYDAGYKTILEYRNVVVKGDTVRYELLETNELIKTFGMKGIRFYPQFIFKEGLVWRKMPWKKSLDRPEFFRRAQLFGSWLKTNHPEELKKTRKPNGKFKFSFETGKLLRRLYNEWRDTHYEVFQAIKRRHKISAKAKKDGDVEAYVDMYTEDGIYMWPGVPVIKGRKALVDWFTKRFARFYPEIERTVEELIVSGDCAIERGSEDVKIRNRNTGEVKETHGKYVNILRKQPDGSWKVARRIRNLDHPMP